MKNRYKTILKQMDNELESFSKISSELNGYQYEKKFREITDRFNQKLFQVSQGKVPKSKNESHKIQTSFGNILVKKKGASLSNHPMGFKISPLLQEHMCRIGSKLPFEEASEELDLLLRVEVNSKQIERICHCYGEHIAQVDWEKAHSDGVQLKITECNSDPIYCMADGSMLLTREDSWKEIKLGRVFSESALISGISKERNMIFKSVYCAHFGNSDDFWKRFNKEIPANKKLVFICDGAKCLPAGKAGLWNNIDDNYPESTQILDYYHCKEHICQFSKEYFKGMKVKQQKFINDVMDKLTSEKVDEALKKIEALNYTQKSKQEEKRKLLNYLTNNKKRIDYGKYKKDGLLIGSGPIEAANRDVIQKRLKLSGQRWTIQGAQQVANLRVALKSDRWDRVLYLINEYQMAA